MHCNFYHILLIVKRGNVDSRISYNVTSSSSRLLHCALAAAQCIVIGPVCGFVTAGGRCPNARAVFASL